MPPHTYTVTVSKDDFNETFTENSVSKIFLRLKGHVELNVSTSKAFGQKYISRRCKHENFTIEMGDRDKIDINESKKASNRRKYQKTQSELQELHVLRQQVEELKEILRQHNIAV